MTIKGKVKSINDKIAIVVSSNQIYKCSHNLPIKVGCTVIIKEHVDSLLGTNAKIIDILNEKVFDVVIEANVVASMKYKIIAYTEQEAVDRVLRGEASPVNVSYNLNKRKNIRAMVYSAGTMLLKFAKSLF